MHAEIVSATDTAMRLPSHHTEGRIIFSHLSSPSSPERPVFVSKNSQIEKRIYDLIPTYGVEKTYRILLDERKQISLDEIFSIAIKKFGENIKTKDLSLRTSEDF